MAKKRKHKNTNKPNLHHAKEELKASEVKSDKTTEKDSYIDQFLGKEIELAPNLYDAYTENKAEEKNDLIIRPENKAVLKNKKKNPVAAKKAEKKELEKTAKDSFEDLLLSVSDPKKQQSIDQLFSRIDQEKASFDEKLSQQTSKQKEEEKKPEKKEEPAEKVFDKMYSQSPDSKPRGFLGSVFDLLNSDVVWLSVALALVIGVIMFYLQALQPAIVNNYTVQSQNQAVELVDDYNSKVTSFFDTQGLILSKYTYLSGSLCSQMQVYTTGNEDIDRVSRARFSFNPNSKLKDLENYEVFYLPETRAAYSDLYNQYSENLNKFSSEFEEMLQQTRFLNYRNNWLQACQKIEADQANLANINQACTELVVITEQFLENGQPRFWSDIKSPVEDTLARCQGLNQQNLNTFITNFFLDFESVMIYRPDYIQLNEDLVKINEDFNLNKAKQAREKMNQIYEEKISLTGSWYIISFEF